MFKRDTRETTGKPQGPSNMDCPLHKQPMAEVCHRCPWWLKIVGTNPQTGDPVEKWECAVAMQVMAQMDTTRKVVGVVEATDSMRNELIERADAAAEHRRSIGYSKGM